MEKAQNFNPSSLDMLRSGRRSDPLVAGLCVIVSATGKKTWTYRRRIAKSGVIVQLTLGTYPANTISDAREWASGLNAAVERGEDPRVAMRTEEARKTLTVAKAHAIYMEAMRRGGLVTDLRRSPERLELATGDRRDDQAYRRV